MSRRGNKSKELYGSAVKRSEYDDGILQNNRRTGNRLKIDMTYYDRAQKVIMKDLGKESLLLQNKIDSDKRTISMGLYGSKIGVPPSAKTSRKYTPTSSSSLTTTAPNDAYKPAYLRAASRTDTKFPWDKEGNDKDVEATNEPSSSLLLPRSNIRLRSTSSSSYPSSRVQTDDFLASILNEALNDELLYTQRSEIDTPMSTDTLKAPNSSRRKPKTSRSRTMMTPSDSIVNSLVNAQDADEVIY